MSANTDAADRLVAESQKACEEFNIPQVSEAIEKLADAVSELINAVQEIESHIEELEGQIGEDPGIQISHLKDSLGDVERRIERLERQGD